MAEILLGTSGWSYSELVGVFYPGKDTRRLSYYSRYFRTTEIDSTFYAFPTKGTAFGWARYTPDDFVFSAKLPRLITHDKKLDVDKGVKADLLRFLDIIKPLIDTQKLGPVLVQLPPNFKFENHLKNLERFLEIIPTDIKFALEFRDRSWLRDDAYELLQKHDVANTIVDEPLLPPSTVTTTRDFAFVRWHGHGKSPWYNYRYTDTQLEGWKPKLEDVSKRVKRVYGYFNNHFHGFAIENSLKLMKLMGSASPSQLEKLKDVTERIESPKLLLDDRSPRLENF